MKKTIYLLLTLSISMVLTSCASLLGPPTVTFVVDKEVYSKYTLLEGEQSAIIPEDPMQEDNQFLGWYEDEKGEKAFNETSYVGHSKKVYGLWKYYDVEFDDKNGNIEIQKQEIKKRLSIPNDPHEEDYYFCGWKSYKTGKMLDKMSNFNDITNNKYVAIWSNVELERRSDGQWKVVGVKNINQTQAVIPTHYKGKKVVEISDNCFKENKMIKQVVIPETVFTIGAYAFYECDSLESLEIPEGITKLPNKMAYGCDRLTNVKLPSTLEHLGDPLPNNGKVDLKNYCVDVFTKCPIESINLPNNLKTIGHGCLAETKIYNLFLPSSIQTIEQFALRDNDNLSSITIPRNVKRVGIKVLDNCDNLEKIIYNCDVDIPEGAFENNKKLEDVIINGSPRKISKYAFKNCDSLEKINIPKSVELLENESFGSCDNLKEIYLLNDTMGFLTRVDGNPFEGDKAKVGIYKHALEGYKLDSYWNNGIKRGWVALIKEE